MTRNSGAAAVSDDERRARLVLPSYVADYYATGTGSGQSLAEAGDGWASVRFRPRILQDLSGLTTATTVLGVPMTTPVLVAPMAQQLGACREGEAATARGAYAAGSLVGVSTHTGVAFADIDAAGAPWWFQVYVMRDRDLTERLVRRAVAAGAGAIVLTADMNAMLARGLDPRSWPEGPARARHANLTTDELVAAGVQGLQTDRTVGPDTVGWLREISGLPIVVKGVLRADDSRRAVDAGAAAVVVSTHGGRRMGASVSSAAALPEIVAAVGAEVEVYADSGIRSGEHVAAALALGARAVFVGRPVMWALAADGAAGVERVIRGLTEDLGQVMLQLGAATPAELSPDLLG